MQRTTRHDVPAVLESISSHALLRNAIFCNALAAFFLLLVGLPLLSTLTHSQGVALFEALYRSGALIFGGGRVVLPLLRDATVAHGWVSDDVFLAGYGAAQAVPGPLFTFSAYLGAVMGPPPNGLAGAAISLIAIFVPGILALVGTLPFWDTFRRYAWAQAIMRGVNAAVVGLLGAALYSQVWTTSVEGPGSFGMTVWEAPPLWLLQLAQSGVLCLPSPGLS